MVIAQLTVFKVESVSKHFLPPTGVAEGERHEFWQNQKRLFSAGSSEKEHLFQIISWFLTVIRIRFNLDISNGQ